MKRQVNVEKGIKRVLSYNKDKYDDDRYIVSCNVEGCDTPLVQYRRIKQHKEEWHGIKSKPTTYLFLNDNEECEPQTKSTRNTKTKLQKAEQSASQPTLFGFFKVK